MATSRDLELENKVLKNIISQVKEVIKGEHHLLENLEERIGVEDKSIYEEYKMDHHKLLIISAITDDEFFKIQFNHELDMDRISSENS